MQTRVYAIPQNATRHKTFEHNFLWKYASNLSLAVAIRIKQAFLKVLINNASQYIYIYLMKCNFLNTM